MALRHTTGHDNDDQQYDNADNDAHPHLHVLPPHLLPHAVGAAPEAVGLLREVLGLVLQVVQALATFAEFSLVGHQILFNALEFLSLCLGQQ